MNYGVIGNCRSAALITEKGSIDWCCLPDFDSPSVFARILDTQKGGSFSMMTTVQFLRGTSTAPMCFVLLLNQKMVFLK
jgi:GH15 family glucan-1,4-alpha-glucosidase